VNVYGPGNYLDNVNGMNVAASGNLFSGC
jgi:hypothetical protein